jgi:hypothetical protein
VLEHDLYGTHPPRGSAAHAVIGLRTFANAGRSTEEMMHAVTDRDTRLTELYDRGRRIEALLNASGEFWVQASEVDGSTVWRADVSDRKSGKWFTLTIEADDNEEG